MVLYLSETTNYELSLTDDDQVSFYDWRNLINGISNSNMVKLDTILGNKANLSDVKNVTLSVSGWDDNTPCSQIISIEELTASQNGVISPAQNLTVEQMEVVSDAEIYISAQRDGELVVSAKGTKPTCDIPATIILFD